MRKEVYFVVKSWGSSNAEFEIADTLNEALKMEGFYPETMIVRGYVDKDGTMGFECVRK